ncbi:MAG: RNA 2',3'-cyclic phosphodiesterase [Candidatus Methanofastidiosia archaeon]
MTRLFVSIDIEKHIKEKVKETYSFFSPSIVRARFTAPENLHFTLKFIGERSQNDVDDIIEILRKAKENASPFDICIGGFGAFPTISSPRIIWVGGKSENMTKLANIIDNELSKMGIQKEKKKFSSHLTIARVREVYNRERLSDVIEKLRKTEFGCQKVKKFILKKSVLTPRGPIYSNVEVFAL